MQIWPRLFGYVQPEKGSDPSDTFTYQGIDFVLPQELSCIVGQESTQLVPVAMIGPKEEDKFEHCVIALRGMIINDRTADQYLIETLSKYGGSSPASAQLGPWRGFQTEGRDQEQRGQTQWLHMLLICECHFLIVKYSAPVEWYEFYRTRLVNMLASSNIHELR